MPTNSRRRPTPEERLQEAILSHLKAADSGLPVRPEDLLGRYPDLAVELGAFFDDQESLGTLLAPLRAPIPPGPIAPSGLRSFGKYELVEEIGRGGMGVVYKARQRGPRPPGRAEDHPGRLARHAGGRPALPQ
jgi:hypothetical protein